VEIKNVRVYGLEESIIASGYPMMIDTPNEKEFNNAINRLSYALDIGVEDLTDEEKIEIQRHKKRIISLANAPLGSGHDCALKGIVVQYDLTAPEYFWRQFDRYHFHDYISSQSKMHRILRFDIDKICNKYVSRNTINELNYWIDMYNNYEEDKLPYIVLRDGRKISYTRKNIFQIVLSNCPMGLQLTARIKDNYLQLKSKYYQRINHPLEEWKIYCKWIETLPMAKSLIVGRGNYGN